MGAISDAIAADAASHGAQLRTSASVSRVLAKDGEVEGVALADGTEIRARTLVSAINPKLLFLDLIERDQLPEDLVQRMQRYRCGSATLRMNVALGELPELPGLGPGQHPEHGSGIILGPSLDYMDEAWRDARARGWSRRPVVEMLIPSLLDPSLAPPGQHVASLFCQHFAPELPGGRPWPDVRQEVADQVIAHVSEFSPNFGRAVIGRMVLTPRDLEDRLGLVGGDIFHGALGLDQLFSARPVLGHGDYRGPLAGLYLSGAGTHPGGGVTGLPGHNAAREVLRDLRRRRWKKTVAGRAAGG